MTGRGSLALALSVLAAACGQDRSRSPSAAAPITTAPRSWPRRASAAPPATRPRRSRLRQERADVAGRHGRDRRRRGRAADRWGWRSTRSAGCRAPPPAPTRRCSRCGRSAWRRASPRRCRGGRCPTRGASTCRRRRGRRPLRHAPVRRAARARVRPRRARGPGRGGGVGGDRAHSPIASAPRSTCLTCGHRRVEAAHRGWEALDRAAVAYVAAGAQRGAASRWPVAGPGAQRRAGRADADPRRRRQRCGSTTSRSARPRWWRSWPRPGARPGLDRCASTWAPRRRPIGCAQRDRACRGRRLHAGRAGRARAALSVGAGRAT
jgi:hypothetical protein